MRIANFVLASAMLLPAALLCQQSSTNPQAPALTPRTAQDDADHYLANAQTLLSNETFDELDRMAAAARSSKSRFAGGGWKLHTLYSAVTSPANASAKDDSAWEALIAKLQGWEAHTPDSITARVALAGAYVNYAWKGRGADYAVKVGDDNWKLFDERLKLAKTTLDEAASLKEKCPEWFWQMQTVALGQGWDGREVFGLFQQAITFEPEYQYFYRAMARFLMPKWYGEEGDAEAFANKVLEHVGGQQGSFLYYEMAAELLCDCGHESPFKGMSWQRIRRGYADLEKLYGTSNHKLNQFAYLAVHNFDLDSAREAFVRIGDNWDKEIWRTKKYFDDSKTWSARTGDNLKTASVKADNNLETAEGRQYDAEISKEFPEKLSDAIKKCVDQNPNELQPFNLVLQMGSDGKTETILHQPVTAVSACLLPRVTSTVFSPPPRAQYWVKVGMNFQP